MMMVMVIIIIGGLAKHDVNTDWIWPPTKASLALPGWKPLEEGLCDHSLGSVLSSLP